MGFFSSLLELLESCPDNCDRSCYRCLRSYKNKFEHDLLDRHIGASLLRAVVTGDPPAFQTDRLERSTDLLFEDLSRHGVRGLSLRRNVALNVPGFEEVVAPILAEVEGARTSIIGLHSPLTPDQPSDLRLLDLREYSAGYSIILVDELVVRRNLPSATADLLPRLR